MNPFFTSAVMLFLLVCVPAGWVRAADARVETSDGIRITEPGSPFAVAWGFRWGYQAQKSTPVFMPVLREMKVGATRLYIMWNQVEPEKGRYVWEATDAFVNQLNSPEEGMISFWTASSWATRHPTEDIPGSPPKDANDYYNVVHQMVSRYKGKVRYWQNDCEPNHKKYWDGTAKEFVAATKIFHQAVKDADPQALVVIGGHNGNFNPPPEKNNAAQLEGLEFFDEVLKNGRDYFDVFDVRLYRDIYNIPDRVGYFRRRMADLGYQKLFVCTEFDGPSFFSFPENTHYAKYLNKGGEEQKAVAEMFSNMATLPPQTQMFMVGCAEEIENRFRRIQNRDMVMRRVLMLSAGVQKSYYWEFRPSSPAMSPQHIMTINYSKMHPVEFENGVVTRRYPLADAFKQLGDSLGDVELVKRINVPGKESIYLFEAQRHGRGPVYVVWDRRDDVFNGEDQPAVHFDWEWKSPKAKAVDVIGQPVPLKVKDGRLFMDVSVTPIYFEP